MNSAGKNARDLVTFYLDAGVDALIGEEPIDRFADETAQPQSTRCAAQASLTSPFPQIRGKACCRSRRAGCRCPGLAGNSLMAAREAAKNARDSR